MAWFTIAWTGPLPISSGRRLLYGRPAVAADLSRFFDLSVELTGATDVGDNIYAPAEVQEPRTRWRAGSSGGSLSW